MKRPVSFALLFLSLMVVSSGVFAQSRPAQVTVLSFEEPAELGGLGEAMYGALRTQIEFHRDYQLNDVPMQSLDDLLLALGCGELSIDCGEQIADMLSTDYLAWGDLSAVGNEVHLTMVLWDLALAQEVRVRVHALPRESMGLFREHHQVVGRSLLYDNVGSLRLSSTPAGALVRLDGRERGETPLVVNDLQPGFYRLEATADGYGNWSSIAVVDIGESELSFSLPAASVVVRTPEPPAREPGVVQDDFAAAHRGGGANAVVPWVLIGVGTAATAVGVVYGVRKGQTQRDFDDLVNTPIFSRTAAQELQDQGEREAMFANVFVASGLAVAAGGILWKVLAPDRDDEDEARMGFQVYANTGGVGLTFGTRR